MKKQSYTNRFSFAVMLYVVCNLFVYFSSMLKITPNNSLNNNFNNLLVDKLVLTSNLTD